jgi:Phytanoyl-CoA dioxygenase (PhyH)
VTEITSDSLISPWTPAPGAVAAALRDQGYMSLDRVMTPECLSRINEQTGDLWPRLNQNWPGAVHFKNQRYLTHCLANSPTIFDFMVRGWCFQVLREYFGSGFRLTDQRVYVTETQEHMQWHVDNEHIQWRVSNTFDAGLSSCPGIIFLFYLCDVDDGEFQVIDGSNRWSHEQRNADLSDEFILAHHAKDMISFRMPAGSGLVYDTTVVHRAHPIRRSGWERKSLLLQVEKKAAAGEPVLIDTRYAAGLSPEQQYFLGFGATPEYRTYPETSVNTMRPGKLARQIRQLSRAMVRAVFSAPVWGMSFDSRSRVKKILRRGR